MLNAIQPEDLFVGFSLDSAALGSRPTIRRHLADLRGAFADSAAYEAALARGNPLVYEVTSVEPASGDGQLHYGLGVLHPGKIGNEFFLTKGANSVVLEISATPYLFTFKRWDWNRLGLDGLPRPVNLRRGRDVIDWSRDEDYARAHLVNRVTGMARGIGWREERTGLHEAEFIETRRHWFTAPVPHDTGGGVNVLNLVEGEEAVVESPSGAFAPFVVHYAETFIVPAAVGPYTIRPHGPGAVQTAAGNQLATIKAFVRANV